MTWLMHCDTFRLLSFAVAIFLCGMLAMFALLIMAAAQSDLFNDEDAYEELRRWGVFAFVTTIVFLAGRYTAPPEDSDAPAAKVVELRAYAEKVLVATSEPIHMKFDGTGYGLGWFDERGDHRCEVRALVGAVGGH